MSRFRWRPVQLGFFDRLVLGSRRIGVFATLLFEMSENGSGIYAQIFGGLCLVPAVSLQNFHDVPSLELLLRLSKRDHRIEKLGFEIEVLGTDDRPFRENGCLLNSIFELPDISRPTVSLQCGDRVRAEAAHG